MAKQSRRKAYTRYNCAYIYEAESTKGEKKIREGV